MSDRDNLRKLLKVIDLENRFDEISTRSNKMGPSTTFEDDKLTRLDLSRLQLTSLPKGLFDDIINLRELKLFGNALTELPEELFDKLPQLIEVHLKDNNIKSLRKRHFQNNPRLFRVFLLGNPLPEDIAKVFPNRPAVENLLNLLSD